MRLTELIPEEQKIKYLMGEIAKKNGIEITAEEIEVEKDPSKQDSYVSRIRKPAESR